MILLEFLATFEITSIPYFSEIATDEISFKGRRSMKLADIAPTTGFTQMFSFETEAFNPQEVKYADFTCKVKYYVQCFKFTKSKYFIKL